MGPRKMPTAQASAVEIGAMAVKRLWAQPWCGDGALFQDDTQGGAIWGAASGRAGRAGALGIRRAKCGPSDSGPRGGENAATGWVRGRIGPRTQPRIRAVVPVRSRRRRWPRKNLPPSLGVAAPLYGWARTGSTAFRTGVRNLVDGDGAACSRDRIGGAELATCDRPRPDRLEGGRKGVRPTVERRECVVGGETGRGVGAREVGSEVVVRHLIPELVVGRHREIEWNAVRGRGGR